MITHGYLNSEQDIEYNPQMAMIMFKMITDINIKVTTEGANCFQQYILQKVLKYK